MHTVFYYREIVLIYMLSVDKVFSIFQFMLVCAYMLSSAQLCVCVVVNLGKFSCSVVLYIVICYFGAKSSSGYFTTKMLPNAAIIYYVPRFMSS